MTSFNNRVVLNEPTEQTRPVVVAPSLLIDAGMSEEAVNGPIKLAASNLIDFLRVTTCDVTVEEVTDFQVLAFGRDRGSDRQIRITRIALVGDPT